MRKQSNKPVKMDEAGRHWQIRPEGSYGPTYEVKLSPSENYLYVENLQNGWTDNVIRYTKSKLGWDREPTEALHRAVVALSKKMPGPHRR